MQVVHRVRALACAAGLGIAAAFPANANFTCEGQISYLGLSPEGTISVAVSGFGVWYICSQTSAHTANGGITFSPEGCRAWFASMLAAQKAGHPIRFFFTSSASTSNGPECTALGAWTWPNPAPYHFNVMN